MKAMSNWFKILLLFAVCWAFIPDLAAQDPIQRPEHAVKGFDITRLNEYKADPDYQYDRRKPETSWLQRIWRRVQDFFDGLFSAGAGLGERILILLLVGIALVVILYFLFKSGFQGLFMRGDRKHDTEVSILNTDVRISTLGSRIHTALAEKDYRSAYRWSYIELLHKLAEAGIIRLHANKTNRDYLHEMNASPLRPEFSSLAHAFDFVWYGEYPLNQERYEEYAALRDSLLKQVVA
jgi:hypothetical protein